MELDLSDPATFARSVPHEALARLRQAAPVAWIPEKPLWRHAADHGRMLHGSGYWAVLSHAAVSDVSRRASEFSSHARGAFLADPLSREELELQRQLLINMDGPAHTRLRRFVAAAFTPRAVAALGESITRHARQLVEMAASRTEIDVVTDLAAELPLRVLSDLLGIPADDRPLLFRWSNQLVGFDDAEYGGGDVRAYRSTLADALTYARRLAVARRQRPQEDLYSQLAVVELNGQRLDDEELAHLWLLLVIGGNESTRHFISGAIHALLEHPREMRRLTESSDLLDSAVEELLRWVSPVMQFRRTAVVDSEIAGQRVRAGDKVVLYYIAANRDEAAFERPHELDLGRASNPHLAFGIGPHFCLGAHLARAEARALLHAMTPRLRSLEPVHAPARLTSNFMNGLKSLTVRVLPT